MVNAEHLRTLIEGHHEWLLVRETGRTFPLERNEIDIAESDGKAHFGFLDDDGFHSWRLNGFSECDREIAIDVAGAFGKKRETMQLVPRESATQLIAEIERARLEQANEIAALVAADDPGIKLGRVALNEENGRFAQILFTASDKTRMTAIADITGKVTVEGVLTHAMLWLEKLGARRNQPVNDIWIMCEKRQAKAAQKLLALLTGRWQSTLNIIEIDRKPDPPTLRKLPKRKIHELWREKAPKLTLPLSPRASDTASRLLAVGSDATDLIFSRQGETLRYNGLPFARVRSILGRERSWFGVGRNRHAMADQSDEDVAELNRLLMTNRSADTPNKRHHLYRAAPEAWLESILRRDVTLLDANLVLSPIYNQFRSSNDKIDLLALRRDGRLVIIELKTQPDRASVFQTVDYWRKIELQRRRGILAAANLFNAREILDKPAIIYIAAPAWSFHRDFEFFARSVSPEIELWRFELHENWREKIKVVARHSYS